MVYHLLTRRSMTRCSAVADSALAACPPILPDPQDPRDAMLTSCFEDGFESALIAEGLITSDQLAKARKIVEQLDGNNTLGDVLVDMHWVSEPRLEEFMRRQRSKLRTGEILISRKLVTEQDVKAALEAQKKMGLK